MFHILNSMTRKISLCTITFDLELVIKALSSVLKKNRDNDICNI